MNKAIAAIFILGLLLRLIDLSNHPAGFTPDEASFAYDAYSILNTGADQWGNKFPLSFKSFGDYKLPLYGYISIPFIWGFGLTEQAVRFPNGLVGSMAILATYFLVQEVFKSQRLSLSSALLLAISPWHIPMSRGAFEANITTFILPATLFFFFKGLKEGKYMVIASLLFGLNLFSYHSPRFVTPVLFLLLIILYRKKLRPTRDYLLSGLIAAFVGVLSILTLIGSGSARLSSAGVFSQAERIFTDRFGAITAGEPILISKLFNNKLTYIVARLSDNYLQYFSFKFWFTEGAGEGTYGMLPGNGVLYLIELLFLAFFVRLLVKSGIKEYYWLIIWLLLAPIPASLASGGGFAANRAATMMPAIQIASAIGAVYFINWSVSLKGYRKALLAGVLVVLAVNFASFTEDYFYQQPSKEAKTMIYGPKQVFAALKNIEDQYSTIVISKSISEPHIFVSFYNKLDPHIVQAESRSWDFDSQGFVWVDQLPEYNLQKYIFVGLDWERDSRRPGVLLVGAPNEFRNDNFVINKIKYPNGEDAFWIVDPNLSTFASR